MFILQYQLLWTFLLTLLVGSNGHLLPMLELAEVPLGEHQVPQHNARAEEVERDDETEDPGSVGELAVESNDVEILPREKLSCDLARDEPAANNEEEDAEHQHSEESNHPEEEAGQEDREELPSILHSVAGLLFLEGHRLGINILSE